MKLIVFLIFTFLVSMTVYQFAKRIIKGALFIAIFVAAVLMGLQAWIIYQGSIASDKQCSVPHSVAHSAPKNPQTAADYFLKGDYDYDTGNCKQAIADYSLSIQKDPGNAKVYNNRAYTYLRLRQYDKALPDLDKAIELNPKYIRALMNRGDLYNYYGPTIDRQKAVADYERVIALGGGKETSVCGHLFLARHGGWNLGTVFDLPSAILSPCK